MAVNLNLGIFSIEEFLLNEEDSAYSLKRDNDPQSLSSKWAIYYWTGLLLPDSVK